MSWIVTGQLVTPSGAWVSGTRPSKAAMPDLREGDAENLRDWRRETDIEVKDNVICLAIKRQCDWHSRFPGELARHANDYLESFLVPSQHRVASRHVSSVDGATRNGMTSPLRTR